MPARVSLLLLATLAIAGCSEPPARPEWWFTCQPIPREAEVPVLGVGNVTRDEPPLAAALDQCRDRGESTLAGAGAVRSDRILGEERTFAWRDVLVSARRVP